MFPLPGVFLFPHQVLPLNIFEHRYRTMVVDLLDGPGRLVIAAPVLGASAAPGETPEVVPVAGLGEILRHEKHDDGRYTIWVLGLSRVHIEEVECDTPYRQVECLPFLETAVPEDEAQELAKELREAATERLKEPLPLPDTTPPGLLADLLMQTLHASRTLVERAFVEPNVLTRAQLALAEAHRRSEVDEDGSIIEYDDEQPESFSPDDSTDDAEDSTGDSGGPVGDPPDDDERT